jgi:hypothetical protein
MPPAIVAAGIGAVASVGGGLIASSGAKSAAKTQERASREATAAQTAAADKQIALQEPFRQGGMTAQSRIFELLGLQDPNARAAPTGPEAYGLRAVNTPSYGGDGGFGGFGGATSYVDAQGNPVADVNAYMAANPRPAAAPSADFGKYGRDFGTADFEADPGYAFRQSEGMKALERSAAARGSLMSGSTLKGIQRFGQDLASQEYTNAFNRYQVNRSNQLNPLQSLMGAGQSATNVQTGVEGQLGQNQATNLYNAGAARASGYVGSANALAGALGSIGQTAAMYPAYQAQNKFTEAQTKALEEGRPIYLPPGGGMYPPTYYPRGTPYNPGYDAYAGAKG